MQVGLFFRRQKAAVNDNRVEPAPVAEAPGTPHASVISAGTSVAGNIDSERDMLIEGAVRGSVRVQRLTIGLEGVVEGDISAEEVTVRGTVKGPIHARHIHLEEGAEVEGDITTTTIAIDTGARLTGAVWQGGQQAPGERYAPVSASSWDSGPETGTRSLLPVRTRINGAGR
jgi:cytoskeletal protein CcmA (bactofilin family)